MLLEHVVAQSIRAHAGAAADAPDGEFVLLAAELAAAALAPLLVLRHREAFSAPGRAFVGAVVSSALAGAPPRECRHV